MTTRLVEDFHEPNWFTAEVQFFRTDRKTVVPRREIVNIETMERYNYEPMDDTRIKCGILAACGIPFYTLANMICNVIRAVTLTFTILGRAIATLANDCSLETLGKFFVDLTYETPMALLKCVWDLIRAPFYALGMEFCALCGILSPITWRPRLAAVEREWREFDRSHHMLERFTTDGGVTWKDRSEERISDYFTNRHSESVFYIAYCFQPWGSLNDDHIIRCRELPIST